MARSSALTMTAATFTATAALLLTACGGSDDDSSPDDIKGARAGSSSPSASASGAADAETFPASGDCEINADGSIGTPYTEGKADQTPPCGIRYLRASNGAPYQMKASITWEISWEGTGGAQGGLPDGAFETPQDMEVQEIQSINR